MKRQRRFYLVMIILLWVASFSSTLTAQMLDLTDDEKDFISSHPFIRIGIDPQFVPFEFIDERGNHMGISSDIVALLEQKTGLTFSFMPGLSWVETIEMAERGELDVLPAVGLTFERSQYLTFLPAYISFQRAIVVRKSNTSINGFEDLSGRQVAVQEHSSHQGFLEDYPNIGMRTYETVEAALLSVNRGEEVAFLGNEATSSYISRTMGLTELRFIPIQEGVVQQLHVAVRKDWPLLASILTKALASITDAEYAEIFNRWIRYETKIDYTRIIQIAFVLGFFFLIILGISAFWIVRLRKAIESKDRAQKQMEVEKKRAELADQEKSHFMARISHEIRTPLNGIHGMAYLLEKTELTTNQRRYLNTIKGATRTMLVIINDILEYSRLEQKRVDLEHVPFNLDEIIQSIVSIDAWTVKQKGLTIQINQAQEVPAFLIGDSTRLTQILTNLIHNSMKFTLQGGIEIRVDVSSLEKDTCSLIFEIRDTGIGMTEDQVHTIFQPFIQANQSIARRFGGSGLGLSIVQELVELMDGDIKVESKEGVGSTFTVVLPFDLDHKGLQDNAKRREAAYFEQYKALMVVADKNIASTVGNLLSSYQIKFDTISSQDRAIAMFAGGENVQAQYDLLIMDSPNWENRPLQLLAAICHEYPLKTMLFLEDDSEYQDMGKSDWSFDMVLPVPIINSVFFNALLDLFGHNAKDASSQKALSPAEQIGVSHTVLVVEDNMINQMIAQEILTRFGFSVLLASNGKEGVDAFATHEDEIDVILMDLHMEVMDGYEASTIIRKINDKVPIIITSADLLQKVEEQCKSLGETELIGKPYDPDYLVERIQDVISRYRGISASKQHVNFPLGLKRVGNDKKLYERILSSFLQDFEPVLQQFQKAVREKDFLLVSELAHKIKGGCGAIGADATLASQVQKYFSGERPEESGLLVDELVQEMDCIFSEVKTYLKT